MDVCDMRLVTQAGSTATARASTGLALLAEPVGLAVKI
jgi:hypothetical protein